MLFFKQILYFDKPFIERPGLNDLFFPNTNIENQVICVSPSANDNIAVLDATPNSISANFGKIVRSKPTIPPTNAFTITKIENCNQFSLRPSLMFFFTYSCINMSLALKYIHFFIVSYSIQIGNIIINFIFS